MKNCLILVILFFVLNNIVFSFSDVAQDYKYKEAIDYVKDEAIVSGYPDGTFKPDQLINRAEFTKIIVNAVRDDIPNINNCFVDVQDQWFSDYVCLAEKLDLVSGYPDGTFKPDQNITFAEAAKIVAEALELPIDYLNNDDWYTKYVSVIDDYYANPGNLDVAQEITRGDMAMMIFSIKNRDVKFIESLDNCVIDFNLSTKSLYDLGFDYIFDPKLDCANSAFLEIVLNRDDVDQFTKDELFNIAFILTVTKNYDLSVNFFNKYLSEDDFEGYERGFYQVILAQALFDVEKYDESKMIVEKVRDDYSADTGVGYMALQLEYLIEILQPVTEVDVDEVMGLVALLADARPDILYLDVGLMNFRFVINSSDSLPTLEDIEYTSQYVFSGHVDFYSYYITELASLYRDERNFVYSEMLLNRALELNSSHVPAYLEYSRLRTDQGRYSDSLLFLDKALEISPNYYKTNNLKGYTIYLGVQDGHFSVDDYAIAIPYLEKTMEIVPTFARSYNTMGVIMNDLERYDEAIYYYNEALKREDYVKPYNNLALLYNELGDHEKALEYRAKALSFN